MSSIQEVKAQLGQGSEQLKHAVRAIGTADSSIDNAIEQITAAAHGSGHTKPGEAMAAAHAAKQKLNEARAAIAQAMKAANEFQSSI
ncbi:MAG: hypothetical protein WCA46_01525 [Actinocatenispora sp.]